MKVNEDLLEKPDHSHYASCCTRMSEISKFSKRLLIFAVIAHGFMLLLTFFAVPLGALSLMPSLVGSSTSAVFVILQSAELIAMTVLAALGMGRFKICQIILLAIYMLMVFLSFASGFTAVNSIPFAIAVIGSIIGYPAIASFLDYRHLRTVEGFPYFNSLISDNGDSEYKSMYIKQDKTVGNESENVPSPSSDMQDIPDIPHDLTISDLIEADERSRSTENFMLESDDPNCDITDI